MANRNIFIVGRSTAVVRLSYDAVARKANLKEFEGIVNETVKGVSRINCLAVVVATMEQLKAMKDAGDLAEDKTPTLIITLGMVTDMIADGTFKYWAKNGGVKSDGTAVDSKESEAWAAFAALYQELYMDVTFKNVSDVKLPKNPRYAISMEQRTLADYAEKAWDRVKITAPEVEEADGESL